MPDEVYSVSDITADIRGSLEDQFRGVWIEGEISNHRLPASGHHYFTLKDSFAQLACVLFRGAAAKTTVPIKDGMQVQVRGDISVYEARGQYQLIAQLVQPKGYGELQAKFEELKRKLDAEGLFDPERKKPIPVFPRTIGVVTSPTGAAIRDMLQVLGRRAPWVRVIVYPVRVQGDGSAEEIAGGIRAFDEENDIPRPDLIIVARGGGSMEDLWAFNEEIVARSIADCSLPVMSGVGHEIDFTIADFVADRREPTPSAAAENATPDGETLLRHLAVLRSSLESRLSSSLAVPRRNMEALRRELEAREPRRIIRSWMQSLDFLGERMEALAESRLGDARGELSVWARALSTIQPEKSIRVGTERCSFLRERLDELGIRAVGERKRFLESLAGHFHSLSPEATVKRGFSMTFDEEGKPLTSVEGLQSGARLRTRLSDGDVNSIVE